MRIWYLGLCAVASMLACEHQSPQIETPPPSPRIDPDGQTLDTRILAPKNYERKPIEEGSFAEYLRQLPLKPNGTTVKYHNGETKPNNNVYDAVVDLDIGKKNLHQCADAIIRLRAEHLWHQKQFDKIHFNFTSGFNAEYSEWMKGKRIVLRGNDASWVQSASASNTYKDFWNYMEVVFNYAGTASLSRELKPVSIDELEIGDVFIKGGFPGHAAIVVDVAINPKTNKKVFLIAQSYMPAQEIQILKNPNDENLSPWYSTDFGDRLRTPEYVFKKTSLMRFQD